VSAAIIGVGHARDEARRLQRVEQANKCHRRDVENSSESGLIDPFVPREMEENSASRASHAGKLAHFPIVATAPQPSSLVEQRYNRIWIIRVGIILGPRCRPDVRDLLQQMADGRFVRPVATHELLHDRLGQELIKPRLVGREPRRRRTRGCAAIRCGRIPPSIAPSPAGRLPEDNSLDRLSDDRHGVHRSDAA
jgi:hypothetical protein